MVKGKQICKSFGDLQVLKGVDLEVEEGEVIAIVGRSGAGKTTLLHILGTLDEADSGEVLLDHQNLSKISHKKLAAFRNDHIGFIFQFHHLLDEFTALENVCIPGWLGNKDQGEVKKKAAGWLDYLGLSNRCDHKPSQLSGGEQQRVAIARALINNPKVIMADEPTGNLDSRTSEDIHKLIFQLRDEFRQTFIIVTHNKELAALCDRTLYMEDGLIIKDEKGTSHLI